MIVLLFGGEDVKKRSCERYHRTYVKKGSKVLIIPWTTHIKEDKYRGTMKEYFTDLGGDVDFLEREDDKKTVKKKVESADIIYLPGGDTEVLLENLRKNKLLIKLLKGFKGILMGNSAGAYAISKYFVNFHEKPFTLGKGLGITELAVITHYEESMEEDIRELERKEDIRVVRIRETSMANLRL